MFFAALGIAAAVLACREITAPLFAPHTSQYQNGTGTVIVSPANMRGWAFYNDQADAPCTDTSVCRLVQGPASPPSGTGSAELATAATSDGVALVLQDYKGTRLDSITDLHYSTYRQTADAGNNLAIALQFNVDYDLTDQSAGYQGRLVYEPYQGVGGNVPQNTWQSWDAKAGKWWGTRASVPVNGVLTTNPCVQATPCTWAQLLAAFPNIGVHSTYGAVVLKAGSGWASFRGNVDALVIGVGGSSTTYDFELYGTPRVTLIPPDFFPKALFDSLGSVTGAPLSTGPYRRDIVTVTFRLGTPLAARQAAIDSIGGVVVGGRRYKSLDDGTYYVRIQGGTTAALLDALRILHRQPQVAMATWWGLFYPDEQSYRRPVDGIGWRDWVLDPTQPNGSRINSALEYVRAPYAWGCSVGSFATAVAVIDDKVGYTDNIAGNLDYGASRVLGSFDQSVDYRQSPNGDHGARVASVLAATGNDNKGMTGMAWSARLIIRDRFSLIDHPLESVNTTNTEEVYRLLVDHIVASAEAGASIINLSMQVQWPGGEDTTNADRMEQVRESRDAINLAIDVMEVSKGLRPLLVVSAGNYHVRMELAGYAGAKAGHLDQVLVVGGLNAQGGIWSASNIGDLIDVYAPAEHVGQANGNNRIVVDDGTSFAAPLVAGTAVLLKDFDPTLTAAQMIDMIRKGARTEDNILKLDAYGALRQAAQRTGAPLCGNRLYANGSNLVVQRGIGTDTIGSLPANAFAINAKHGGHRVEAYTFDTTTTSAAYTYSPTGWTRTSMPSWRQPPAVDDGGAYNGTYASSYGFTHGGDTLVDVHVNQDVMQMFVYDTVTWNEQAVGAGTSLPPALNTLSGDCDYERFNNDTQTWDCFTRYYYYHGSIVTRTVVAGVSPLDASSYVAVGFQTAGEVGGPAPYWDCTVESDYGPPARCRNTWRILRTLDSLQLFHVDRATGTATRLTTRVGASPTRLAVSEDGRELLLSYQEVPGGYASDVKTFGVNDVRWADYPAVATCVTEPIPIVRRAQGDTVGVQLPRLASETGYRCPVSGTSVGIPTFSPSRIPLVRARP